MSPPVRVALLGFSHFERNALSACFRLTVAREPCFEQVTDLERAAFILADADHAPTVQLVQVTERLADTVFIGTEPPEGASVWMARPIDPLHVLRELDALVTQRTGVKAATVPATPAAPTTPEAAAAAAAPAARVAPDRSAAPALPPAAAAAAAPAVQNVPDVPDVPKLPDPPAMPSAPVPSPPRVRRPRPVVARLRHALLVDDSAIAGLFLQKCLQPYGLEVSTAASSGRATLLMSQQRFDIIFLDVELGEDSPMDGLALCQQIRRHPVPTGEQAPVVVMVSAHHRELDRVRGTLAGCDAYLAKPLQQAELDKLLRRHGTAPMPPATPPGT